MGLLFFNCSNASPQWCCRQWWSDGATECGWVTVLEAAVLSGVRLSAAVEGDSERWSSAGVIGIFPISSSSMSRDS